MTKNEEGGEAHPRKMIDLGQIGAAHEATDASKGDAF